MAANPWEIVGAGLRQTSADVGAFADRRRIYDDMVQRRIAAQQEQHRIDEEARLRQEQAAREKQKFDADQAEKDRQSKAMADFRKFQQGEQRAKPQAPPQPYLAPGMGPQGEAMHQPPQEFETVAPTREQMQSKALELGVYGDPGVKAFFDDTNPKNTLEGQKEILGMKAEASEKVARARQEFQTAMEEYRQGRIDSRTLMSIRGALERAEMSDKAKPKTASGMPVQPLGDTELKAVRDLKNTAFSINKIRILADSISNLKKGPIAGFFTGKNPYDTELQALDRLVNQTVPSMARGVFGEVGVLTDDDVNRYKKMLASVKDDPTVANVILDELQEKIASAYNITVDTYSQGGRDVSMFPTGMDFKGLVAGGQGGAPRPKPAGNDRDPLGLGF
jgi:hypothetical protein